jgi:hypothetical protein
VDRARTAWYRAAWWLALLTFCWSTWSVARSAARDPDWNLDAIPYAFLALSLGDSDVVRTHHRVYEELRAAVPPEAFTQLTAGAYRGPLYADPAALAAQRALYINKPAYIALVAVLHRAGMNVFSATRAISVAAFALLAALVLGWLLSIGADPFQLAAATLLVLSRPIAELAIDSTPDAIGLLPLAIGAWLIFVRGRPRSGLLVAATGILLRPDAAVMVLLLAVWATFFAGERRLPPRTFAIAAGLVVASTMALQKALGAVSTRVLIKHVFEQRILKAEQLHDPMPWSHYGHVLRMGLDGYMLYHPSDIGLHLLVALVAAAAALRIRPAAAKESIAWLALVWCYVIIHFFVLPDRSDRYFAPTYLLSGIAALTLGARSLNRGANGDRVVGDAHGR